MQADGGTSNAAEIRDARGWQHTGDIAWRDQEVYFYIVDRKKDMITSGGFNVYSSEVEACLNAHPAVLDCSVFGIPDEKSGEAVHAAVQLKPGEEISSAELLEFAKEQLGSVKAPKDLGFLDALPRSPVGKEVSRR